MPCRLQAATLSPPSVRVVTFLSTFAAGGYSAAGKSRWVWVRSRSGEWCARPSSVSLLSGLQVSWAGFRLGTGPGVLLEVHSRVCRVRSSRQPSSSAGLPHSLNCMPSSPGLQRLGVGGSVPHERAVFTATLTWHSTRLQTLTQSDGGVRVGSLRGVGLG